MLLLYTVQTMDKRSERLKAMLYDERKYVKKACILRCVAVRAIMA